MGEDAESAGRTTSRVPGNAPDDPSRWLAFTVIGGLMLLHALPYGWATITLDTARDLYAASRIADGQFVHTGPILNGSVHLGPIWFYLLAPALALSGSQALTLLWAGLLSAAKFPLAYALGRQYGNAASGLLLASMLALPGWSTVGMMLPTHTVMVEAATLAEMLFLLRLAQGSGNRDWIALGAIAGLAMHAHPSACFALLPAPLIWWMRRRTHGLQSGALGLGLLLGLIPLFPMLAAEAAAGWPQLPSALASAERAASWPQPAAIADLLRGTFFGGPSAGLAPLASSRAQSVLLGLVSLIWLMGLAGLLLGSQRSRFRDIGILALLVLVVAAVLAMVRHHTPYYMALVLLPPGMAIASLGLANWSGWRWLLGLAALPVLAGSFGVIMAAQHGQSRLETARQSNVRIPYREPKQVALLGAWQLDAIGRSGCREQAPVVLHGSLAMLHHGSLALAPELACGRRDVFEFSGPGGPRSRHWLGLPPRLARSLGWQPTANWLDTPKTGVIPLWPPDPLPHADREHYPHFTTVVTPGRTHRIVVETPHEVALVTTNLLYPYRGNRIVSITANGQTAHQVAHLDVTDVWMCHACESAPIHWTIELISNSPESFEVVAFDLTTLKKSQGREAPGMP